jgi:hypothetical protein
MLRFGMAMFVVLLERVIQLIEKCSNQDRQRASPVSGYYSGIMRKRFAGVEEALSC